MRATARSPYALSLSLSLSLSLLRRPCGCPCPPKATCEQAAAYVQAAARASPVYRAWGCTCEFDSGIDSRSPDLIFTPAELWQFVNLGLTLLIRVLRLAEQRGPYFLRAPLPSGRGLHLPSRGGRRAALALCPAAGECQTVTRGRVRALLFLPPQGS